LRIQAARQRPPGALLDSVIGPCQPGERVHDQYHVLTQLDAPAGALQRQLGNCDVALCRIVEAGRDHLAHARCFHLEDLLWPLVDQEDEELSLGIVEAHALGDGL
jgi:hypothetical protein